MLHSISDMKNNAALPNIHWHCLNTQLNYELWIYFLFLHVKIKTVPKTSQFSCFHYTTACFHAVSKSIRQILYHFQKRCVVKAIRYKNRAELFVLNRNKRPIRYEFHNRVKSNRYYVNMVTVTCSFVLCGLARSIDKLKSLPPPPQCLWSPNLAGQ